MQEAGQRLRRRRELLNLRYRDVEEASLRIAEKHHSDEFVIGLSRLSDIENRGTVPSMYRLYSLAAIYRLDYREILNWYGVPTASLQCDAASIPLPSSHLVDFGEDGSGNADLPLTLEPGFDLRQTSFLSRMVQRWGSLPLRLLGTPDRLRRCYALVGTRDWSMYPLLRPGALLLIDEKRRQPEPGGWEHEAERPVYFLEHREGYLLGWCSRQDSLLLVQPHPSSGLPVRAFRWPGEVEIIGQVIGVAMELGAHRKSP